MCEAQKTRLRRGSGLVLLAVLLCPLPGAADGLRDFLLLDASIDNSRLRIARSQLAEFMRMRRDCLNALPATAGYWVPTAVPQSAASALPPVPQWQALEATLAGQRAARVTQDACRHPALMGGRLEDSWYVLYDRIDEEHQQMLALGPAFLEYPQRLVLGIVFDDGGEASVYELLPGGPAARAGLRRGDEVIAVAGGSVVSSAGVVVQLAAVAQGQPVLLDWIRWLPDGTYMYGSSEMVPVPAQTFWPPSH